MLSQVIARSLGDTCEQVAPADRSSEDLKVLSTHLCASPHKIFGNILMIASGYVHCLHFISQLIILTFLIYILFQLTYLKNSQRYMVTAILVSYVSMLVSIAAFLFSEIR